MTISTSQPSDSHAPRRSRRRGRLFRATGAVGLATALALLTGGSASAHVRVHPDSTVTGSFSALTFRVPNESDTAGTVAVQITLPTDTPFLSVSAKPVPGWSVASVEAPLPTPVVVEGTTVTKAVRTVTWTAGAGSQVKPGEYQEFSISAGPLPAPGTVELPATQTYSDGTVVMWDQATPASGPEPEHPAPAFDVTAAGATPSGGAAGEASQAGAQVQPGTDVLARVLGGVGALAGAAALALVVLRTRGSRPLNHGPSKPAA